MSLLIFMQVKVEVFARLGPKRLGQNNNGNPWQSSEFSAKLLSPGQ